jgi:hypothetical protein
MRLDQFCEYQRIEKLRIDPDFHYRKKAVVSAFRWHQIQGKNRAAAYQQACLIQLTGLKPCRALNVDARTTWLFLE